MIFKRRDYIMVSTAIKNHSETAFDQIFGSERNALVIDMENA